MCVLWSILTVLVCIIMFLSVINFILSLYIFLLTQNKILHLGFDYHHNIIINVSEFDSIHRSIAPPCSVKILLTGKKILRRHQLSVIRYTRFCV